MEVILSGCSLLSSLPETWNQDRIKKVREITWRQRWIPPQAIGGCGRGHAGMLWLIASHLLLGHHYQDKVPLWQILNFETNFNILLIYDSIYRLSNLKTKEPIIFLCNYMIYYIF